MFFYLNSTKGWGWYSESAGRSNQFVVALELGLDTLAKHGPPRESYFCPMWNPRDRDRSISRSRDFLSGAALSWTVDNVDGYVGSLARSRFLLRGDLRKAILDATLSVQTEVDIVSTEFLDSDDYRAALLHLLIQWRNNLTHVRARNELRSSARELIIKHSKSIFEKHRDLDVAQMLAKFDRRDFPEFKEVASLLSAARSFVETVDDLVVKKIDIRKYVFANIRNYFDLPERRQKLGNAFSVSEDRRRNYVTQVLGEFGLVSSDTVPQLASEAYLSYQEITKLCPNLEEARRIVLRRPIRSKRSENK